jgi:transcriptional regulator with XRE-family HTH domain
MKVNTDEFNRIVGLNIEVKRKRAKMTLEELAEKLNVTSRTIQNYEKGKGLSIIVIYKLMRVFNCELDEFFLELDATFSV